MDPLLREIPLLWRAAVLLVWRRALRLRWNIKRYERRRVGGRPVLGPLQATSIAVVIEDEEADCGRKVFLEELTTLTIDLTN